MLRTHPLTAKLSAVALVLISGLGCKRNEPPTVASRVGAPPAVGNPPHPFGVNSGPNIPPPPMLGGAAALAWDLPKGWTDERAGGMRFATLRPPVPGKIDVSVVMLPGPAGGELANVNRWRGQIGLPPVDEAARGQIRKEVGSKAGTVSLYDFTHEGVATQRMLAGLLFVEGRSWFVKMVGEAGPVEAARSDFLGLLETLHFSAGR